MARTEHDLLTAARRQYELGRLGSSWRASALALPMILISLRACNRPEVTLVAGAALMIACAFFSWRGLSYKKGVFSGLVAGFMAALVPFFAFQLGLCAGGAMAALCQAVCLFGGAVAGAMIAARAVRLAEGRRRFLIASTSIACLTGSLGCALAGLGGVLGMALGVLVLTAPAVLTARAES